MEVRTANINEFTEEVVRFTKTLVPRGDGATIIALSGELGAGKTTLTQIVAKEFGVTEPVNSPTFVIEKVYELPVEAGHGFERLIHIDAYRLNGAHEVKVLGWDEIITEPKNLVLIEWPEQVGEVVPVTAQWISLKENGDERIFTYGKK